MDMQTYQRPKSSSPRLLPWVVLFVGLATTAVLAVLSHQQVQQQRVSQLEKIMKRVESNLTARALIHEQFIEMVSQTYANPQYGTEQLRQYIRELDIHRHYPEITTITMVRRHADDSGPHLEQISLYNSSNISTNQMADLERHLQQTSAWSTQVQVHRSSIMQVQDSASQKSAYYLLYKAAGPKQQVTEQGRFATSLVMSVDVKQLILKTLNGDRSLVSMDLVDYLVTPKEPVAHIQADAASNDALIYLKSFELNGLPVEISLNTLPSYTKLISGDFRILLVLAGIALSVMLFIFLRLAKPRESMPLYAISPPEPHLPEDGNSMVDDMLRSLHLDDREVDDPLQEQADSGNTLRRQGS